MGFSIKNPQVIVIGGGNTAVEEALYLSNIASKVTLIHRRDKLRAEAMLVDKLNQKITDNKIEVIWNANLVEVLGDDMKVTGALLKKNDSEEVKINCAGVFIAIGHQPNTTIFKDHLEMNDSGYLYVKGGSEGESTLTSKEGYLLLVMSQIQFIDKLLLPLGQVAWQL